MEFSTELKKLSPKLRQLVAVINDPEISPTLRKQALAAALNSISSAINSKAYDMSAFDFGIRETLPPAIEQALGVGLAKEVSDSIATGALEPARDRVDLFAALAVGAAVGAAASTAKDLGKYTTLQRFTRNGGDCQWCKDQAARGVIRNPQPQDYGRHKGCDCLLESKGYGSRNGEVKNYRPLQ